MYTAAGKREETSPLRLPNYTGGNVHPRDGHYLHREGKVNANTGIRKDESIKPHRKSMMGLRDKMACAGPKGAKAHKFVYTNRGIDHILDNPVGMHVPARCANRGVGGRSGGLARGLRG